jgi:hypothetical protein
MLWEHVLFASSNAIFISKPRPYGFAVPVAAQTQLCLHRLSIFNFAML